MFERNCRVAGAESGAKEGKVGLGSVSEAEELGHVWSESMMTEVSFERLI